MQWVTEFDDNNHCVRVLGYCVRDRSDWEWKTVFNHKEEAVCQKIANILNEES